MKNTILLVSILSMLFLSCQKFNCSPEYIYEAPEDIGDGLEVGTLEEVNIDVNLIAEAACRIQTGRYEEVHSMLIFKDGKLVFEDYFEGHKYQWDDPYHHGDLVEWDRDMLHHLMSSTKSVTSALIGIAIEEGFIESADKPIFDYLPEHQHLRTGGKEKITIEHLLTMTAGLAWPEWSAPYSSVDNPNIGAFYSEKDPVSFILEMPLVNDPGTDFNYSTGNMVLLGEIIRNSSGMTIDEFSEKYLFEPLGIDTYEWAVKYENGVDANNLMLTPRAMAKIGATFLNGGVWNGAQIVPAHWVEKSATTFPGNEGINVPGEASGKLGYSYTWWTKDYSESGKKIHMFTASGWGGQHIMVLPEVNTVVVFTCGNYVTKRPPYKILEKYVIPSLV